MPGPEQSEFLFDAPAPEPASEEPSPDVPKSDTAAESETSPPPPVTPSPVLGAHGITRTFLGWDQPLVDLAMSHLTSGWDRKGSLDLGDRLVVVPTRHAGRRLREKLSLFADETAQAAVIPPLVVTPEFLISPDRAEHEALVASQPQTLIGLIDILLNLELDHYRRLFPVDPVERNFNWALKTANDLLRMRSLLSEAGHTVGEAAQILAENEREPERWRDITRIDRALTKLLKKAGTIDIAQAQRDALGRGTLPPEIRSLVVIGEPDPIPLAVDALRRYAREYPVEILIYAPDNFGSLFDPLGRPVIPAWTEREIALPEPEETVHPSAHPAHQAERTLELVAGYDEAPEGGLAIGVPDPEVIAPLEKALAKHGWGTFDPAGRRLSSHGISYLLRVLQQLVTSRSYTAFSELLRIPGAMNSLCQTVAEGLETEAPTGAEILQKFDALESKHLPDTIEDAISAASRNATKEPIPPVVLSWAERWLRQFGSQPFDETLTAFLGEVYAGREFKSDDPEDVVMATIADLINRALDDIDGPVTQVISRKMDAADRIDLLLHLLDEQVYYPERAEGDIDLQGWLELLWEDAPHLVITGMNDGQVPESIVGHPFLPDSARVLLGLRHNESRLARDAYSLTALIEMRRAIEGRVDFVFGRTSQSGDPLRPSRLLFCCSDEELPERTLQLFETPTPDAGIAPWELAFPLRPEPLPPESKIFHRLSVTAFRAYLACPFRFYLRYGLGMDAVEQPRGEMNSRDFGNLIHGVLHQFAMDPGVSVSEDAKEIRDFFTETLERFTYGTYGNRLTVPLTIQLESARQRLGWWAEIEAEQRRAGWKILKAETYVGDRENNAPFTIADHEINGQVDRVERNAETGVVRLLDFKTGRRKAAEEAHITHIKRTESETDFPSWALTTNAMGASARWIDLQLPLYQLAMQREFPDSPIEVGYVTLARAKNEVGLDVWSSLSSRKLEDAQRCAAGVIDSIREEIFWPPAEKVTYDDFAPLFFGDAEVAVDAGGILT